MGRVSTFTAISVCAVVALLAVGLATGRPEARAAEDLEYPYEGDALVAELEDAEGLVPEEEGEVRERRDAEPQEPLVNDDPALELLVDGFEIDDALEGQALAPKLGNEKKACGRGRNRPPTDTTPTNATDTTATGEEADLSGRMQQGGGGRRTRGSRNRNITNAAESTAPRSLVL